MKNIRRLSWTLIAVLLLSACAGRPIVMPTKPCRTHLVVGEPLALNMRSQSMNRKSKDGTYTVSNSCGVFVADVNVTRTLSGGDPPSPARIAGELGEWCSAELYLGHTFLIFLDDRAGSLHFHTAAPVLHASDGRLAISPMDAPRFDAESKVTNMTFGSNEAQFAYASSFPKDERDRLVGLGWVRERDGFLEWTSGVYLEDTVPSMAEEKCFSYDEDGFPLPVTVSP
jgi:hypothetical protein